MTQNFENHAKFVPAFHVVVLGIFTINLSWSFYRMAHAFSAESVISLLLAIASILLPLSYFMNFCAHRTRLRDPAGSASP
jgi:hypothetical protein